jgi:hypothetical protein
MEEVCSCDLDGTIDLHFLQAIVEPSPCVVDRHGTKLYTEPPDIALYVAAIVGDALKTDHFTKLSTP